MNIFCPCPESNPGHAVWVSVPGSERWWSREATILVFLQLLERNKRTNTFQFIRLKYNRSINVCRNNRQCTEIELCPLQPERCYRIVACPKGERTLHLRTTSQTVSTDTSRCLATESSHASRERGRCNYVPLHKLYQLTLPVVLLPNRRIPQGREDAATRYHFTNCINWYFPLSCYRIVACR
jgi:hypothetical protein